MIARRAVAHEAFFSANFLVLIPGSGYMRAALVPFGTACLFRFSSMSRGQILGGLFDRYFDPEQIAGGATIPAC